MVNTNIEVSEYARLLRLGLGRAILYLRDHDPVPYREVILHACLNDATYEWTSANENARFMLDVLQATGESGYHRERIVQALAGQTADELTMQQVQLLRMFAQHGGTDARQLLYDAFASPTLENYFGAEELIRLDGIDGLLYIAEHMGARSLSKDDQRQCGYLLQDAVEKFGETPVRSALRQATLTNQHIQKFISIAEAQQPPVKGRVKQQTKVTQWSQKSSFSYDDLLPKQDAGSISLSGLMQWGKSASDADIERAAADLLAETDAKVLRRYLQIFRHRAFPRGPEPLLTIFEQRDEQTYRFALGALAQIQHPSVRALALRLMNMPGLRGHSVELLINNYEDGDYNLIRELLNKDLSDEELHNAGFDLPDFYKAHWDADAVVPILLTLYEKDSCMICRERFVELLLSMNRVPEWMRAECQYDANEEIRAKVKQYSQN